MTSGNGFDLFPDEAGEPPTRTPLRAVRQRASRRCGASVTPLLVLGLLQTMCADRKLNSYYALAATLVSHDASRRRIGLDGVQRVALASVRECPSNWVAEPRLGLA